MKTHLCRSVNLLEQISASVWSYVRDTGIVLFYIKKSHNPVFPVTLKSQCFACAAGRLSIKINSAAQLLLKQSANAHI